MKVDDLFSELGLSFTNIDSKIILKRQSIEDNYQKNVDEVNAKFESENVDVHADAFNQHREILLKQIYQDRGELLEIVNTSWETIRASRVDGQNELNRIERELKDKYSSLCLNKAGFLDFQISPLFKYKLTRPFELAQLNKYSNLLIEQKNMVIKLQDDHIDDYDYDQVDFYQLKVSNKYLIIFLMRDDVSPSSEMFLISEDGNELDLKLPDFWIDKAGASNSYIFISGVDSSDEKSFDVHMYDFKLNLLRKFSLSLKYNTEFITGNNELAFTRKNINDTLFFNANDLRFISFRKWLMKKNAYFDKSFKLIHINKCYFYLINSETSKLRIYERNGKKIATVSFGDYDYIREQMFVFDNDYNIYFNNSNRISDYNYINIYNSNGKLIQKFSIKQSIYFFKFDIVALEFCDYAFWQDDLMDFLSSNQ